jgi:hypothetical protein
MARNSNIYCSRTGGATINRKFYPHPRTSDILAGQILRHAEKMEARAARRALKRERLEAARKKTEKNNHKQMMDALRRRSR